MMEVGVPKSTYIEKVLRKGNILFLISQADTVRLFPFTENIIHVMVTEGTQEVFPVCDPELTPWTGEPGETNWEWKATEDIVRLKTAGLMIIVDRHTGAISYYRNNGQLLIKEEQINAKAMESFESYLSKVDEETVIHTIQTPDGAKKVIEQSGRVFDQILYHTDIRFEIEEKEALYGLGQSDDGAFNLRNTTQYLHQSNRKIAIPLLVSSKAYGIYFPSQSPSVFENKEKHMSFSSYGEKQLSYVLIAGKHMKDIIAGFRLLTGKAAMLPKWAFGYIQSFERYESEEDILSTVEEFHKRKIGLDCIVLDWLTWEDGMWGQKTADSKRFPDLKRMINKLHEKNVHLMVSIWPNMTEDCDNYKEMKQAGHLLGGTEIYDAFSKEARALYWKQAYEGWYQYGLDGWWCDSSEALTPEWNHVARKPKAWEQWKEFIEESTKIMSADKINAYGLYHAKGIYEGQRSCTDEKRVLNLTRSGAPGSQKYGTVLWSGDIEASYQVLKEQIAAGLSFCASGMPYWTLDIGAFFVKKGIPWYWNGGYPKGNDDLGYRELYTRWYQLGAFLPMFRSHGTDVRREPWQFGEQGDPFYDAIVSANKLRYQIMPYIYSVAADVWRHDESMIRLLAFDYPEDERVYNISDQFLFGPSMMICPITEPILYEADSKPVMNPSRTKKVYLPDGTLWHNYYTEEVFKGGQFIEVPVTIEYIPIFVKAGGIIPVTQGAVNTAWVFKESIQIKVFSGADGEFTLYEDAGDGYGYEKDEYELTPISYDESEHALKGAGKFINLLGK